MNLTRMLPAIRSFAQRRFVRDTAILQAGQLAIIVVQALTNFLMIRLLGKEQLGTYTLVVALASLAGVLDISGSTRVALTQLSRAIGAGDIDDIRDVLAYFVRINLQFNLPLVLGFFLATPYIAEALYHNLDISRLAGWLVFTELTDVPTQMVSMFYQSSGRMRSLFFYETSKVLISSLVTVIILLRGWGIPGLISGTLVVNVAYALTSIYLYHHLARIDPRLEDWSALLGRMKAVKLGTRFRLGFSIAIDKNLSSLIDKVLILFLGTLGPVFMANYSVALKIVTLPQPLVTGLSRNLDSFLPRQIGLRPETLRQTFTRTTLYSGAIWSIVTLGIALGGPILLLVFFPEYSAALPFIFPLLFQSLAIGLGVSLGSTFRVLRKLNASIAINFVTLVLLVPTGLVFVSQFGQYGAVWFVGLLSLIETVAAIVILRWGLLSQDLTAVAP